MKKYQKKKKKERKKEGKKERKKENGFMWDFVLRTPWPPECSAREVRVDAARGKTSTGS